MFLTGWFLILLLSSISCVDLFTYFSDDVLQMFAFLLNHHGEISKHCLSCLQVDYANLALNVHFQVVNTFRRGGFRVESLYTPFFKYPQRKKSSGLKSGETGGHSFSVHKLSLEGAVSPLCSHRWHFSRCDGSNLSTDIFLIQLWNTPHTDFPGVSAIIVFNVATISSWYVQDSKWINTLLNRFRP